jgi:hypothetical protein
MLNKHGALTMMAGVIIFVIYLTMAPWPRNGPAYSGMLATRGAVGIFLIVMASVSVSVLTSSAKDDQQS